MSEPWVPEGYERWVCDYCGASCNFEAMEQCARRFEPGAQCAYDRDQPLSMDDQGRPSAKGCFEFVQLKGLQGTLSYKGEPASTLADHLNRLSREEKA